MTEQGWHRDIAERVADLAYAAAGDGTVLWVNPAAQSRVGWLPDDLVGRSEAELIHPEDAQVLALARSDAVDGPVLIRVRTLTGGLLWMAVRSAGVGTDPGSPLPGTWVTLLTDVDELVRQRDDARDEAGRRAAIVETMLDPHVLLEPVRDDGGRIVDFVYVDANEPACRDQGMALTDLMGASVVGHWPAVGEAGFVDRFAEVMETGEPLVADNVRLPGPGGSIQYYDTRAVRADRQLSLTWRDVTPRWEAERSLARSEEHFRLLAENILDVIARVRGGVIVWVSGSVEQVLGWTPDHLIGRDVADFVHIEDLDMLADMAEMLSDGEPASGRFRLQAAHGGHHWVESHAKPYRAADGTLDGVVSTLHIVDTEVAALAELDRRARFDDLTGVLKRNEAIRRLEGLDRYQRQPGDACGVLFIDIDEFKDVNDTWGHAAGDTVLRTATARMRAVLRSADTVARMGGDEFLVILEGLHSMDEAVVIAEKIRTATAEPIAITGAVIRVTATVGATLRVRGEAADSVIARADEAMYRGKDNGRDHVVVIPPASV